MWTVNIRLFSYVSSPSYLNYRIFCNRANTGLKLHPSDVGGVTEHLLKDPDTRPDDVVEHVIQDLEVGQRNEWSKSTSL